MICLRISSQIKKKLYKACQKAGENECGGILFGQHIGENLFKIEEITADPRQGGSFAKFIRNIKGTLKRLNHFFKKYNNEYTKFNYIGEWHSHPQFALSPSAQDNQTMVDIITDTDVGANFAVLMIVKIEERTLKAKAWTFYQNRVREECRIEDVES